VNELFHSGGGESRPQSARDDTSLVRHEEEARVSKRWEGVGYARVRREVEQGTIRADYPRERDELSLERIPAAENDSGKIETLPDGSISVPLFEEELIVTKRTVLRERVIIRKDIVTDWETVEAELRREHISFDTDDLPQGSIKASQDTQEKQ
jgi:uncharacterized protein (TIGR02271 family)